MKKPSSIQFNKPQMLQQITVSLVASLILFRAAQEFYPVRIELTKWISHWLPVNLSLVMVGLVLFCLMVFLGVLIIIWAPNKTRHLELWLVRTRNRLKWLNWVIAIGFALVPALLSLHTSLGNIITGSYTRLLILLIYGALVAACITKDQSHLITSLNMVFSILFVASLYICAFQLATVVNYPFSLSWSEGNRLYDYSVHLGSDRYIYSDKLTVPAGSLGRQLLWGILFIIPNTPIWLHRFWNVILATIPFLILGYLLACRSSFIRLAKWSFTLWVFLFLMQGPIYTPLILSAILVVGFVQTGKMLPSLLATAIASFYASFSRWTWLLAPPTWSILILLDDFTLNEEENFKGIISRLLPISAVAVVGVAGGLLADPRLFSVQKLAKSTTFSQPLLWYRLLPNATYQEGILLGLFIATAPLIALLVWLILSHRWNLNWLQRLAYFCAPLGFLVIGLVASVKIGGGNNLHNLDMFLLTLVLLSGLAIRKPPSLISDNWPFWSQALIVILILIPAWSSIRSGYPLQFPSQYEVNKAMSIIETRVTEARSKGEVLFIDERQLLTFGYIKNIPLVPEYEKKYLMDQAMANNSNYFEGFYQDLKDHRFSLIISDPIFIHEKGKDYTFGEENNAWVKWVARPLLCYYQPLRTLPAVKIQLLIPQTDQSNCP